MSVKHKWHKEIKAWADGAELIVEMDNKTKQYLLNYAILDILEKQLNEVKELRNED